MIARTFWRDIMIEHIDGPLPLNSRDGPRWLAISQMIDRGWLDRVWTSADHHAKSTGLTDAGRAVLAKALADWADAIERARIRSEAGPRPPAGKPGLLEAAE